MKLPNAFLLILFFLTPTLKANSAIPLVLNSALYSIEKSDKTDVLEVLALRSPRVFFLSSHNEEAVVTARVALATHSWVALHINEQNYEVLKITLLDRPTPQEKQSGSSRWNPTLYSPSLVSSFNQATSLFDAVDSYTDSDLSDNCYNRAHYWARTFDLNYKIKSMKVFVLFTPAYRKEHNFNWWYHVAPFVNVTTSEGQSRVVLDPSYEQSPLDIRKWVFHFASKADHCRVAQYLHEFKDTSALGGCVVITASMYHYIPQDLDLVNPPVNWRCDDLKAVESALRAPAPYSDWKKYTDFLPDYCR